ncbi:MAG: TetR/AcrR family transcriptional regulator [Bryobacterales bacterium]|nr:TetR/AcrR family transcriptional regulator [Bryobacterales bacterium]
MPVLGRTKKDVLQEFRTAEILEAARRVFARNGYNETTVDQIAEEAGVAKGTVYLYFSSKHDLFCAAMRSGLNDLYERAQLEITAADTTADRLRAFIGARLRYCSENRDFFRIYYTEFASLKVRRGASQPEFQDLYDQQLAVLESLLAAGIRGGEVRATLDTPRAAHLLFEYIRAAVAKHVMEWPDEPIESTLSLVFELLWRGIACEGK